MINAADSRDEAEGPLLPEEDAPSDMASFQPPDSDLPSFLEDCNRVAKPFLFFKAAEQESKELLSFNLFNYACLRFYKAPFTHHNIFSSSRQAKLPRGIHQVRPHLKNIDNVPLLVPLFTDCTPESRSL